MSTEVLIPVIITYVATAWIFFFLGKAHQLWKEQTEKLEEGSEKYRQDQSEFADGAMFVVSHFLPKLKAIEEYDYWKNQFEYAKARYEAAEENIAAYSEWHGMTPGDQDNSEVVAAYERFETALKKVRSLKNQRI